MIAHVVAAEVLTKLKAMLALDQSEVVKDLVLRDVPALGERANRIKPGEVHRARSNDAIGEGAAGFLIVLLELGHVMAQSGVKRVRRGRTEYVRFLKLGIPAGLMRDSVELGADRIQIGGLRSVVKLVTEEG